MQHTFVSAHISLEMVETLGIFCLLLLMAEIRLNQLRLVVHPIIYKVLYIPGGDHRISAINSRSRWSDGKGTRFFNPPKIRCIGAMFDPYYP